MSEPEGEGGRTKEDLVLYESDSLQAMDNLYSTCAERWSDYVKAPETRALNYESRTDELMLRQPGTLRDDCLLCKMRHSFLVNRSR